MACELAGAERSKLEQRRPSFTAAVLELLRVSALRVGAGQAWVYLAWSVLYPVINPVSAVSSAESAVHLAGSNA